jgi:hypothetical protein
MLRACLVVAAALAVPLGGPRFADAACCYFSAQKTDMLQPGQKVFITWDPEKETETFTVQPKFEGNALDFGMVIPTPSQPKLHEMPRDFFTALAVFSILKHRETPSSKLLPAYGGGYGYGGYGGGLGGYPYPGYGYGYGGYGGMRGYGYGMAPNAGYGGFGGGMGGYGYGMSYFGYQAPLPPPPPPVKIVETGLVGSLDYKILEASRADELFQWLKDHKYSYSGDEATLNYYVQKKWYFTVMKIDTMQMKKNKDGTYSGEVTPTRFEFTTPKLVYPLKITQISVKNKTEALFYVQAPTKIDLSGDFTYQHTWVPMLQSASGCTPGGLPGKGADWLASIKGQIPGLLERGRQLGFRFQSGKRPNPNDKGRTPTTLEWARKLTERDIDVLKGTEPFAPKSPDEGFTKDDLQDAKKAAAVAKVIRERLEKLNKLHPNGYLTREAPEDAVRQLNVLAGHLQAGLFITKFRKIFTRGEMDDDLELLIARLGSQEDRSEYEEILPSSPP